MTREEKIKGLYNLKGYLMKNPIELNGYESLPITLIDYAIEALEQEPCDDAISREELLKAIDTWDKFGVDDTNSLFRLDNLSLPNYVPYIHYDDVVKCIKGLPSVRPQEQTGHWIKSKEGYMRCDQCGSRGSAIKARFCHHCGARMVEPQESEESK